MSRKDQEVKETATNQELLYSCRKVQGGTIAQELILAAPSPKAIDEYIQKLKWSTRTAKQFRDAVRLRDKIGSAAFTEWANEGRPYDYLFGKPIEKDVFGVSLLGKSSIFQFGTEIDDRSSWPTLLREFSFVNEDALVTTFDGKGKRYPHGTPFDQLEDPIEDKFPSTTPIYGKKFDIKTPRQWKLNIDHMDWDGLYKLEQEFRPHNSGELYIEGRIAIVEPKYTGGKFPEYYKIVHVYDHGSKYSNRPYDSIRVAVRLEYGPVPHKDNSNPITLGNLLFRRTYPITKQFAVRMEVKYKIRRNLSLESERLNDDSRLISLIPTEASGYFPSLSYASTEKVNCEAAAKAYADASELLEQISRERVNNLDQIIGDHLVMTPPDKLADLFIKTSNR